MIEGNPSPSGPRRTVYVDANPLADAHLTGIGRYTARIALALAGQGPVGFFSQGDLLEIPDDLDWAQDQDLNGFGRRVWGSPRRPLGAVPPHSIGVYGCLRPAERTFPFEISILHDFTPQVVPHVHAEATRGLFQGFYALTLLSSDAAVSVSHSTKADAAWLTDFPQDRILVAHSGPSLCVERHEHPEPVERRPEVGLVVSTLEPRKNAFFLLDWFKNTTALPDDAELWWAGAVGWMVSPEQLRAYAELPGGRRVRFLGVVSDAELCRLYRTAGFTLYPSLYEGFGFPVLDSLRHGTPVLTSYNSSLCEFQVPGVTFFDPCDPATVDEAWRLHVAASPHPIPLAELDARYDWARVARTIREAPERVGAGRAPGAGDGASHLAA